MKPFGMRIFVEVDTGSLTNIVAVTDKILTGKIVALPEFNLPDISNVSLLDNALILYYQAQQNLSIGDTVSFHNEEKVINKNDNIYNVPIELIRSYEKKC